MKVKDVSLKKTVAIVIRGWVGSFLIALLIATSIKSVIADWYVVPTGSMKPTIVEGDRIFANKLAYDLKVPYTTWHIAQWDDPGRGEIVVFNSPVEDKRLVKRVVGLPGDTVAMVDNRVYINGKAVSYSQSDQTAYYQSVVSANDPAPQFFKEDLLGTCHPVMISPLMPSRRTFAPVRIPKGHYFMLGDNRDNSADSRYFGFVDRQNIIGRATRIVISLDKSHHYKPRWERFFARLP
jgi:signal peptidase I